MNIIRKNLFLSIVSQLVAVIYGLITPRLILEQYGSEVNGLTQSIAQFLGAIGFLDMGVSQVVRSALYKPLEKNDPDSISRILVSGRKFYRRIALTLLGYVAVLLFIYPTFVVQTFDWTYTISLIVIMSIGSFAQYYVGVIQEQLIHADQKSYLICTAQVLFYLFNLAMCSCLIYLNCSIHILKLATASIFMVKPLFYSWYIRKHYSVNWGITYREEPIKQKWNGIAQHISAVVLEGTDNIVLSLFATLTDVSIYSVYFMLVTNIHGFYQSAVMGLQSAAGLLWSRGDVAEQRKMFSRIEIILHMVTVFVFCCTGILIVPFIRVYTVGLSDANYIQPLFATLLVLAYGIRCLRTPYNIWILAAGHFKQTQRCHIVAASLNFVISVFAVTRLGLVGVAVGTLIAMCYQTIWMMRYTTKNLIQYPFRHIIKMWAVDILAVALICCATSNIELPELSYWGWFRMAVFVGLIAFCITLILSILFYRTSLKSLIMKGK